VRHEQLSFLAFLDPLTGLPNRSLFFDRFRETLLEARGRNTMFGLALAGLDDFKAVNATLGSEAGDYLLKLAGERLSRCVRGSDIVARLGGDRFGILLPRLSRGEDAKRIADRMIKSLREPFRIGRAEARVGLSLGIALYPPHSGEIDPLYSAAEAALRESKGAGKGRFTLAQTSADRAPVLIEFLTWSEVLAVGIWAIDEQHQALVDLVNRFGNELKAGHDHERLLAALNRLVQATRTHFDAEENLMWEHGLPDIETHREQHRMLLEDLQSLGHELAHRSMSLTMRYLHDWLIRHIDGIDKPMARALRAAGVQ
jgi:diguanylate cyclase (GGDEF)-like protein/hemerythrin-like metal-binding protein